MGYFHVHKLLLIDILPVFIFAFWLSFPELKFLHFDYDAKISTIPSYTVVILMNVISIATFAF